MTPSSLYGLEACHLIASFLVPSRYVGSQSIHHPWSLAGLHDLMGCRWRQVGLLGSLNIWVLEVCFLFYSLQIHLAGFLDFVFFPAKTKEINLQPSLLESSYLEVNFLVRSGWDGDKECSQMEGFPSHRTLQLETTLVNDHKKVKSSQRTPGICQHRKQSFCRPSQDLSFVKSQNGSAGENHAPLFKNTVLSPSHSNPSNFSL